MPLEVEIFFSVDIQSKWAKSQEAKKHDELKAQKPQRVTIWQEDNNPVF